MKLSEKEKLLVLELRKKEENNKPKKIGYAKHNIYDLDASCFEPSQFFYSEIEKQKEINRFSSLFILAAKKGAPFDCFIEEDGSESWYDRDYGLENLDSEWAKNNLEKIRSIK